MINVLIYGINGKMGKVLKGIIENDKAFNTIVGVDKFGFDNKMIYESIFDVKENIDVIIDFSRADSLGDILSYAKQNKTKVVLCSTGYTKEQIEDIERLSKDIAIFRSSNMSVGINLLCNLVKQAVVSLNGYDIEIIEKHHNQKVDAPSGTAIMLADSINEALDDDNKKEYVYGRYGNSKRKENELTIHAVRGGNITGDHEVMFALGDEVVTFKHEAFSKSVFANGAVKASKYIVNKDKGLYNMSDVINEGF